LAIFEEIIQMLSELLDVDAQGIEPHTYLVRDLGVESIDFLELAVAINARFRVDVHDDTIFLRNLRLHLNEAAELGTGAPEHLKQVYPHLSLQRIETLLSDLEGGPVLQTRDLERYVRWQMSRTKAA
jgi:acyl carrier protein